MTKQSARALRKRMTDAERLLWRHLRNREMGGWKFRRQYILLVPLLSILSALRKILSLKSMADHMPKMRKKITSVHHI